MRGVDRRLCFLTNKVLLIHQSSFCCSLHFCFGGDGGSFSFIWEGEAFCQGPAEEELLMRGSPVSLCGRRLDPLKVSRAD